MKVEVEERERPVEWRGVTWHLGVTAEAPDERTADCPTLAGAWLAYANPVLGQAGTGELVGLRSPEDLAASFAPTLATLVALLVPPFAEGEAAGARGALQYRESLHGVLDQVLALAPALARRIVELERYNGLPPPPDQQADG